MAENDIGRIAELAGIIHDLIPDKGISDTVIYNEFRKIGSRLWIIKQDPTLIMHLGVRIIYIHTKVEDGPKDSQIEIDGLPVVSAVEGDYLVELPDFTKTYNIIQQENKPSETDQNFDAVNTYSVARLTLTYYQRLLQEKIMWAWNNDDNKEPLKIFPHTHNEDRPFYDRKLKAIKLPYNYFHLQPSYFDCRSFELIVHEMGHAILDSWQPGWFPPTGKPIESIALHESFGDLSSIFLVLSQLDLVEFIISETKADLHGKNKNILSVWSEQLIRKPQTTGPRNANNDLKISDVLGSGLIYQYSQVFTGVIYDILADIFSTMRDSRKCDDTITLYNAGLYVAGLIVKAFQDKRLGDKPMFKDIAKIMIENEKDKDKPIYVQIMEKHFTAREILKDFPLEATIHNTEGCCGTVCNTSHNDN